MPLSWRLPWAARRDRDAGPRCARPGPHPVTITITAEPAELTEPTQPDQPSGLVIPDDFAGLSFERGPLNPGNAGVAGYLFSPANDSLVTLFRNLGLRNLRIGGGSVEESIPAGTGRDGFTGIDELFAFADAAQVKVIYSLRLLSPSASPIADLDKIGAGAARYIWSRYREHVASFCIGNEPDWHSFHTYAGHPLDPAIYEENSGVPGSAYPSYWAGWQRFARAVGAAAPGAPLIGPDTGAYSPLTYTPDPGTGVSWTERFATDERGSGRVTDITQHYYVGGSPNRTTARQAIRNMLSPEWVTGTAIGSQPAGTTYTPYPWLYTNNLAPVLAAGLRYRLTESNDYLTGVPGASNAFASALWALDYLHWWAAHGAVGVNFHNKQWLYTDTIVPDPGGAAGRFATTPKGYGIKAFALGSAGRVRPATVRNPDGINLTAYCVGSADEASVTIINKTHGPGAAEAAVTIIPPGGGWQHAEVMTLDSGEPGNPGAATATLGGAAITGEAPWDGEWRAVPIPAGPETGISLTVPAISAAVARIRREH
jgi:hypothetical protein